ncbi:hypothetical protein N643_18035 [Salmonella bongori serovar 48:z41:-- str. RKS3044]|nr:hypothetical protein N643_18035 [Salmonella bongori serovar 48:z41:-- str. RKS3044]
MLNHFINQYVNTFKLLDECYQEMDENCCKPRYTRYVAGQRERGFIQSTLYIVRVYVKRRLAIQER